MRRVFFQFSILACFLLGALISGTANSAVKPENDWQRQALRLTGESEFVREEALKTLKKTKNLEKKLRNELEGPWWSLALDVVTALEMRNLSDDVLRIGREKHNSFFYLALNTLLTAENEKKVLVEYRKILFCKDRLLLSCDRTEAEAVVLLETLSRAGDRLSESEIKSFFKSNSWPEVQAAALEHARRIYQYSGRENEALVVIQQAFSSPYTQVREQALFLARQFPKSLKLKLVGFVGECASELSTSARELCKNLKASL